MSDAQTFFLPSGYVHRAKPEYFADTDESMIWQPDVYQDAATVARRLGASRIIDIGCGDGRKLGELHPEFQIVGVDFGPNIQKARASHPQGTWIEHDMEGGTPIPLDDWDGSVVICSDIIEHLMDPLRFLGEIKPKLGRVLALVISTPERRYTRGADHLGPPPNPCHLREWALEEFDALLGWAGFDQRQLGLTRSSNEDYQLNTILALCFAGKHRLRRALYAKRA
jgi:SAM-dependent methyltransferase